MKINNSQNSFTKSEKILIVINELTNIHKKIITVEDVAVELWKKYPSEFCMRGYPQYPNVDIQKYITKLLENNYIIGGVSGYKITQKGIDHSKSLIDTKNNNKKDIINTKEIPRFVEIELDRIIKSKIYKYYSENKSITTLSFVESDYFDFLGTSSRSLNTKDKNIFLSRYNAITKDVIPFCEKIRKENKSAENIIELWFMLNDKFGKIIK